MKIYVISLKNSLDRRASIEQQMASYGLSFEFFDAIDGRIDPPHTLFANYDYRKRLWLTSGKMPMRGELGCYASHYLLWQKCVELNEPIIVLEDDVIINADFCQYISLIKEKTNEYGFLRLEPNVGKCKLFTKEKKDTYSIAFMDNNWGGTVAYSISSSAAQKLIKGSQTWCMAVDNYIGCAYIHKMPSYIFNPSMVEHSIEFETTFQNEIRTQVPLYRKPSREIYSLYKKIRMAVFTSRYKK